MTGHANCVLPINMGESCLNAQIMMTVYSKINRDGITVYVQVVLC